MKQDIYIEKAGNGYILTGANGKRIASSVKDSVTEIANELLIVLEKANKYPITISFEIKP